MAEITYTNTLPKPKHRPLFPQNVGVSERIVSIVSGSLLLVAAIRQRRNPISMGLYVAGGEMLARGVMGYCPVYHLLNKDTQIIDEVGLGINATVTIQRPVEELYGFWRHLERLPEVMSHLESVTVLDGKRSHWVAKAPAGMKVEWDAEIVQEKENELIAWHSLEGAMIPNTGSVRFHEASEGRGTEVHVFLRYEPPTGSVGIALARLFGEEPSQQLVADLYRFKQRMEAQEIATTQGQAAGDSMKRRVQTHMLSTAVARTEREPLTHPAESKTNGEDNKPNAAKPDQNSVSKKNQAGEKSLSTEIPTSEGAEV